MCSIYNLAITATTNLIILSILSTGCLVEKSPTTPSTPPVDVNDLVRKAGETMSQLNTFHFRLYHDKGSLELTQGLFLYEVDADVIKPDKLSAKFRGTLGGFSIQSSLISIGNSGYMTNPLTGSWEVGPTGVNPLGFFSPSEGIASMTSQIRNPFLMPSTEESINLYRVGGKLKTSSLKGLINTSMIKDNIIDIELIIDPDNHHLLSAVLTGQIVHSDIENATRIVKITLFDMPISIASPL